MALLIAQPELSTQQRHTNLQSRDLRSFDIWFEYESDDSDSIRFESDWLIIRKFRISRTCRRIAYHKPRSQFNKNLLWFYVYM